jgi:hypothetical protein
MRTDADLIPAARADAEAFPGGCTSGTRNACTGSISFDRELQTPHMT